MFQLGISAACAYVRKSLDELTSVEDIGMLASPDAIDLHKIVENSIIEAAVRVHERASSVLMEGIQGALGTDFTTAPNSDHSVAITMQKEAVRIVSVKASDSDIVITELIPEDSAEGRKQKNPYICGTHDDPRAVLNKVWSADHKPVITYYSIKDTTLPTFVVEYVPYPVIEENVIEICSRLEYAVLNELTAMVMESYGLAERAALHRSRVNEILESR